jgi:hypothetical protein
MISSFFFFFFEYFDIQILEKKIYKISEISQI